MTGAFINYTITELEVEDNETSLFLSPEVTNYTINPLMPGSSYVVAVSYVNEVGESVNNPMGKILLLCHEQSDEPIT